MDNVIDYIEERGLLEALTDQELRNLAMQPEKKLKVYCGFDPTADSLHLGNMVAIMGLAWFQRCGHTPVVVVGGATGMIGDPSGKSNERSLLDEKTIEKNVAGIRRDLEKIFLRDKNLPKPIFLNNYDWHKQFSMLDFLRDVGKYFRIGPMIGKESVRARMQSEEGMSFTEFSYQLLQAYDFYYLFKEHGVTVQMGGSDQWGNITAGCELIRKLTGKTAYGITFPLLLKSDGQKFGKSEKGALWLSSEKLSPYEFYQYLVRCDDRDVIKLLKMFTFMYAEKITSLESDMSKEVYVPNTVQKILAHEVTELVHGKESVLDAIRATELAHPGKVSELGDIDFSVLMKEVPSTSLVRGEVENKKVLDVIVAAGFLPSKGEGRRLIKNGGLYINNQKISDENYVIGKGDVLQDQFILFSLGKKNKAIVQLS